MDIAEEKLSNLGKILKKKKQNIRQRDDVTENKRERWEMGRQNERI